HGLGNKVLSGQNVFPILIGLAVIVGPTRYFGYGTGPVAVEMLQGGGPFQGIGLPWVLGTPFSIEDTDHKVIGKNQLGSRRNQGKNGHQHVDVGQFVKEWKGRVFIIPPGHAGHAHKVHGEENSIGTHRRDPEMDIAQVLVHQSSLEHFGVPVVNPRKHSVEGGYPHYQVEVGHYKIGVVHVDVQGTVP